MIRQFEGDELVLASHNDGKIRELNEMMAPLNVRIISAKELGLEDPEETGNTFEANALLKARAAVKATGKPALADDSGFMVEAIKYQPGIHSARWAEETPGGPRDFNRAMERVKFEMERNDADESPAAFISVLCLCWPDGYYSFFEGTVDGEVVWPPRGDQGFGYDPMFKPEESDKTFGEMPFSEKRQMNHRQRALDKMIMACFSLRGDGAEASATFAADVSGAVN